MWGERNRTVARGMSKKNDGALVVAQFPWQFGCMRHGSVPILGKARWGYCTKHRFVLAVAAALTGTETTRADWIAINLTPPGTYDSAVYAITATTQYGGARPNLPPSNMQPLVWSGTATSAVSIATPQMNALIYGSDGQQQVGVSSGHASVWSGSIGSYVDLHPPGPSSSEAHAVSGGQQFGWTTNPISSQPSAAMWSGSATSYVNMNPTGALTSRIYAAAGDRQGGWAGGFAGLWSGTPNSFVSLHPGAPWNASQIKGMTESEQVGSVFAPPTNFPRAAMWHGTAASFVLMDPPESGGYSELLATCGTAQVGYIAPASGIYAGIWFGSAASFLNLAQFLPPGMYDESRATSVATDGVHFYVGGYAENATTLRNEAFLWIGTVPAPGALSLLAAAGVFAVRRGRR